MRQVPPHDRQHTHTTPPRPARRAIAPASPTSMGMGRPGVQVADDGRADDRLGESPATLRSASMHQEVHASTGHPSVHAPPSSNSVCVESEWCVPCLRACDTDTVPMRTNLVHLFAFRVRALRSVHAQGIVVARSPERNIPITYYLSEPKALVVPVQHSSSIPPGQPQPPQHSVLLRSTQYLSGAFLRILDPSNIHLQHLSLLGSMSLLPSAIPHLHAHRTRRLTPSNICDHPCLISRTRIRRKHAGAHDPPACGES